MIIMILILWLMTTLITTIIWQYYTILILTYTIIQKINENWIECEAKNDKRPKSVNSSKISKVTESIATGYPSPPSWSYPGEQRQVQMNIFKAGWVGCGLASDWVTKDQGRWGCQALHMETKCKFITGTVIAGPFFPYFSSSDFCRPWEKAGCIPVVQRTDASITHLLHNVDKAQVGLMRLERFERGDDSICRVRCHAD